MEWCDPTATLFALGEGYACALFQRRKAAPFLCSLDVISLNFEAAALPLLAHFSYV